MNDEGGRVILVVLYDISNVWKLKTRERERENKKHETSFGR